MDKVLLASNIDVNDIVYGDVKKIEGGNGGKSIFMSLKGNPIVLQTPEMYAPFGRQVWENEKGGKKFTLDLAFKDMASRPQLKAFFDKMTELDAKLVHDGTVNSFEWLNKKGVSEEVVKALYTKLVKYPLDKQGEINTKYPPTFKLTLPWKDGNFQCEVYDQNKNLVDFNNMETKGAKVSAIIQCLGIWVAAGKYGCTWKVLQMRVVPPQTFKGYAFKEIETVTADSDDEDDHVADPEEVLSHVPVETKVDGASDPFVESSDDELEVKKPTDVAQVKPAKKGVAKKK